MCARARVRACGRARMRAYMRACGRVCVGVRERAHTCACAYPRVYARRRVRGHRRVRVHGRAYGLMSRLSEVGSRLVIVVYAIVALCNYMGMG